MSRMSQWAVLLIAASTILPALGCETGTPSVSDSTEEVTVRGTVTIEGKPATSGEVVFDPSNVHRKFAGASSAPIGPDGSYTLKTLAGENKISVWSKAIKVSNRPGPNTAGNPKGNLMSNIMEVYVKSGGEPIAVKIP